MRRKKRKIFVLWLPRFPLPPFLICVGVGWTWALYDGVGVWPVAGVEEKWPGTEYGKRCYNSSCTTLFQTWKKIRICDENHARKRALISRIFFLNENGPMNDFEKKSFLIKNVAFLSLTEPFDKHSKKEVVDNRSRSDPRYFS